MSPSNCLLMQALILVEIAMLGPKQPLQPAGMCSPGNEKGDMARHFSQQPKAQLTDLCLPISAQHWRFFFP